MLPNFSTRFLSLFLLFFLSIFFQRIPQNSNIPLIDIQNIYFLLSKLLLLLFCFIFVIPLSLNVLFLVFTTYPNLLLLFFPRPQKTFPHFLVIQRSRNINGYLSQILKTKIFVKSPSTIKFNHFGLNTISLAFL